MKKVFNATIKYKVNETHRDIGDMPEELWKGKVFTYEDTYHFDPAYYDDVEDMIEYMKSDLRLVAGGGYSTRHIYDVEFEIDEVGS